MELERILPAEGKKHQIVASLFLLRFKCLRQHLGFPPKSHRDRKPRSIAQGNAAAAATEESRKKRQRREGVLE
jgi:hypothetical protein